MDGSEGPRAQSTRAFARNLAKLPDFEGIAITFWDERLSTVAAKRHSWRRIRHENVAQR
jgi:putative Holliday junction resolvase